MQAQLNEVKLFGISLVGGFDWQRCIECIIDYFLNPKVTAEKSSNSVPINNKKSEDGSPEGKDESSSQTNIPDAASISAFMAQVSNLVK